MIEKVICLLVVIVSAVAQEEEFALEDDFAPPQLANILNARFPVLSALFSRSGGLHSSYYPVYPPVPIYVPMPVPESYPWWDKFFPCKHKKKDKHKKPFLKGDEEAEEQEEETDHEEHLEHEEHEQHPVNPPSYPPYHPQYPPYYPQYPPYPLPPPPPYHPPTTTTTEKPTTTTTTTTEAPTTTTKPTTTKKPELVTEETHPVQYPHPPEHYPHPPGYYPHPPDYHKPGYLPPYPIPYPPTTTTTTTTTTTPKPKPKPTKPLWWTIIFSTPKPATKQADNKRKLERPQEMIVEADSGDAEEQKTEEHIVERPEIEYDGDFAEPTEKLETEDPWAIPV